MEGQGRTRSQDGWGLSRQDETGAADETTGDRKGVQRDVGRVLRGHRVGDDVAGRVLDLVSALGRRVGGLASTEGGARQFSEMVLRNAADTEVVPPRATTFRGPETVDLVADLLADPVGAHQQDRGVDLGSRGSAGEGVGEGRASGHEDRVDTGEGGGRDLRRGAVAVLSGKPLDGLVLLSELGRDRGGDGAGAAEHDDVLGVELLERELGLQREPCRPSSAGWAHRAQQQRRRSERPGNLGQRRRTRRRRQT